MITEDDIATMIKIQNRLDFVSISTVDPDGFPDTRILFNLRKMRGEAVLPLLPPYSQFTAYLGTNTSSSKIKHIRSNNRVCLYYCDYETWEGLTVKGTVEEVNDQEIRKAVWDESWEKYYYNGREGGDFSLLKFTPLHAKYYHGLKTMELDCTK